MAFPKLLQKLFQNNGAGDKLNQDIIPDIPYSKVTDAPSVDSALSSTSENPVQNKVINSALDGKLSKSGGMMTGSITINNSLAGVIKADDNGSLVLAGGNKASSGGSGCAILWLGGGNDSSSFNAPGEFSLEASKGTWGQPGFSSNQLRGKPDGSLTWSGRNVLTGNSAGLTVVAESYSANSWYRKYSDGWIEQGGTVSGTAANFKGYSPRVTTNFPVAFSQTPTIATIEVFPGSLSYGGGVTKRTGRLSLQTPHENSMGDTVYYDGVIEASSTGMTIRVTSSDSRANVTATVYYIVVGK